MYFCFFKSIGGIIIKNIEALKYLLKIEGSSLTCRGVASLWNKSMLCYNSGRNKCFWLLNTSLGAFPNILYICPVGLPGKLFGSMPLLGPHETQLYNSALLQNPAGVQQSQVYICHLSLSRKLEALDMFSSLMPHPTTGCASLGFRC